MTACAWFVGCDLGQRQDYTAIVVIQGIGVPTGQIVERGHGQWYAEMLAEYHVRHIERPKLGTSYPAIVQRVKALLARTELRAGAEGEPYLVVDATGVGRAVVDLFELEGVVPIRCTITGGDTVGRDGPELRVPKRDLASTVQAMLQTSRLKVARQIPLARTLEAELQNFQIKVSATTAHDTYEARQGEHDDLVLALALALWYAERFRGGIEGWSKLPCVQPGTPEWVEAQERKIADEREARAMKKASKRWFE